MSIVRCVIVLVRALFSNRAELVPELPRIVPDDSQMDSHDLVPSSLEVARAGARHCARRDSKSLPNKRVRHDKSRGVTTWHNSPKTGGGGIEFVVESRGKPRS